MLPIRFKIGAAVILTLLTARALAADFGLAKRCGSWVAAFAAGQACIWQA